VHRIRPGQARRLDDGGNVQVGLRGQRLANAHGLVRGVHMRGILIGGGLNRHRAVAQRSRRAHHPQRNLAPIGNENFVKWCDF
jgi:hypothetical protein